jgi:hypothetical protein
MDPSRFSLSLNRSLEDARELAESRGDALISPSHLLYVLFEEGGFLRPMAERNLVRVRPFLDRLMSLIQRQSSVHRLEDGRHALASESINNTDRIAGVVGSKYVRNEVT